MEDSFLHLPLLPSTSGWYRLCEVRCSYRGNTRGSPIIPTQMAPELAHPISSRILDSIPLIP